MKELYLLLVPDADPYTEPIAVAVFDNEKAAYEFAERQLLTKPEVRAIDYWPDDGRVEP